MTTAARESSHMLEGSFGRGIMEGSFGTGTPNRTVYSAEPEEYGTDTVSVHARSPLPDQDF